MTLKVDQGARIQREQNPETENHVGLHLSQENQDKISVAVDTARSQIHRAGFASYGVGISGPVKIHVVLMGERLQTSPFANAVGALCVTGLGAAGGVTSLEDTLAFMRSARTRS